jgi:hypothetical protein
MITNTEIEDCLRGLLKEEGYQLSSRKGLYLLGPDIKATRDEEVFYIEVTGFEELGIERVKDFCQAFFQALSRLNNSDCKHIVIAVPEAMRKTLPIRARIYKIAWERIADSFPELEIWLVDTENKSYERTSWRYWLK